MHQLIITVDGLGACIGQLQFGFKPDAAGIEQGRSGWIAG